MSKRTGRSGASEALREQLRRENAEAAREVELRDFRASESRTTPRVYTETMDEEWWGDV